MFLIALVIAAILSIQLTASVCHSGTVEKCLEGNFHKTFPSPEGPGFATCFPWQNKSSCCSAETTVELKKNGLKNLMHFDWDYCGGLSEKCKEFMMNQACWYYCDPNLVKWQTSAAVTSQVPICSDACDKWFEACKNDKIYSENLLDDFALYRFEKGPVKTHGRPCRTFGEIFKNGEGICNKLWGLGHKYERSSNCMVFDFEGENPNDKVIP